jgi:hypothetical protein
MSAGHIWGIAGGASGVLAICGALWRVSWQLAKYATELREWRIRTDGRIKALEDGNYVPRHRTVPRPPRPV